MIHRRGSIETSNFSWEMFHLSPFSENSRLFIPQIWEEARRNSQPNKTSCWFFTTHLKNMLAPQIGLFSINYVVKRKKIETTGHVERTVLVAVTRRQPPPSLEFPFCLRSRAFGC